MNFSSKREFKRKKTTLVLSLVSLISVVSHRRVISSGAANSMSCMHLYQPLERLR